MKKKISSIVGVALAIVLVFSLAVALVPAAPADEVSASPGAAIWTKFPTPRAGALSSYLLVPGNEVYSTGPGPVEKALDGTLFAYWDVGEGSLGSNVYKSTDAGRTWTRCSSSTDELADVPILAIACSSEDADVLYVASSQALTGGADRIWKSINGGSSFTQVADISNLGAAENFTCFDVGYSGAYFLVVGTTTSAGGGDVWVKQDTYGGTWASQILTAGYDVAGIACSPNFSTEGTPQIVAAVDNTTAAFVYYQYGGGAWTHLTQLKITDTTVFSAGLTSADFAFPSDYNSVFGFNDLWVGVDAAGTGGDVYHIVVTSAFDEQIGGGTTQTDVNSLAATGSMGATKLLATASGARDVYHSEDDGSSWFASKYDPSGESFTGYVVMSDDYYDSGIAWVGTTGAQSAISQTTNFGVTWTQISLINTYINTIDDLAFSPTYAEDSVMFMVTENTSTSDSLWRRDASYWERVADNITLATYMSRLDFVQVSPDFATSNAVFLADRSTPKIWRATDGGRWFKKQAGSPTWVATGGWLVVNSSRVIVGKAAGSTHRSTNNGASWSTKSISGCNVPISFALSPDYANDSTILVGDDSDAVFRSTDGGGVYKSQPAGVNVATAAGTCYVAFDSDYANNSTIYAAVSANATYRLVIGTDTSWKRVDSATSTTWPIASTACQTVSAIATAKGGVYVSGNGTGSKPVFRSINATLDTTSTRGPYFEPMESAWTAGVNSGVWYSDGGAGTNVLWTIKTNNAIWAYEDALVVGPKLSSPKDGASTGRETTAALKWEAVSGAKKYYVWCATDSKFATGYKGGTSGTTYSSTTGYTLTGLSSGRTYYWKVCSADSVAVTGRELSPWSAVWTITTGIAEGEWSPFSYAQGIAPAPGASGIPLKPVFQWNAADWATAYEFQLGTKPDLGKDGYLSTVLVNKIKGSSLASTVWASDIELDYSTTYYWQVRATAATTNSEWGRGAFTTMAKPAPVVAPVPPKVEVTIPPAPPAPTPAPTLPAIYFWTIVGIGAVLVIAVIILIVRTRRIS